MHLLEVETAKRSTWVKLNRTFHDMTDRASVSVSIKRRDEVEWLSDDNEGYTIDFHGRSPFYDGTFVIPKGGSVCSGPVRTGVAADSSYPYTVTWTVAQNVAAADPEIVIKN
jgi:hypothetical protein